jgi:hypothetical protein
MPSLIRHTEDNLFKKNFTSFAIVLFAQLFFSFFISTGCAEKNIAADIVNYVNQGILDISNLEAEALKKYASVTGDKYTSDRTVYETLKNDVIPVYSKFLDMLKKISMQTDEVQQLHAIYVQGAETMYNGFVAKKQALERKDESRLIYANGVIEKGRAETERWRGKLLKLCEGHGVKAEK